MTIQQAAEHIIKNNISRMVLRRPSGAMASVGFWLGELIISMPINIENIYADDYEKQ